MSRPSISRRGTTPSQIGAPSLEASNQSQINDLVQRNRTLTQANKALTDKLTAEIQRSKDAVADIQKQWHLEQREWREGCDVLQSCYRIVQLRNNVELEKERTNVLKELEMVRREKVARLQRDFRITMFQVKETELEGRIRDLEEEKVKWLGEQDGLVKKLKGKCSEYAARFKAKEEEFALLNQEHEEVEDKLTKLQAEHSDLTASAETSASQVARLTLRLESAQTENTELDRTNDELKRSNADLKRQLDKWQNLETKGSAEVESLRKRRIELEVQVKELEDRLEKTSREDEERLHKERKKIEKLKSVVEAWKADSAESKAANDEAQDQLAAVSEQIEKLKAELKVERERVRPPEKRRVVTSPDIVENIADEVAIPSPSPPQTKPSRAKPTSKPKSRPQPRPLSKGEKAAIESDIEPGPSLPSAEDIEEEKELNEVQETVKLGRKVRVNDSDAEDQREPRKKKAKSKAVVAQDDRDNDVEEVPPEAAKKSKGKSKAVAESDPDIELLELEPTPPVQGKKKRKASRDDDEIGSLDIVGEALAAAKTKRGTGKSGNVEKPSSRSRPKTGTAKNIIPKVVVRDEEDDVQAEVLDDPVRKKKKRKINIFPTSAEPTSFNFMPQGHDGGLNIPTILSPVKESEGVPSRSTSGSVMGNLGAMLKNTLTRRP